MTFQQPQNEAFTGATVGHGGPEVEDGTYEAVLKDIEVGTAPADKRKYLIWKFDVTYQGDVIELTGGSSPAFTPKSKATEWATTLFARPLEKGEDLTVDMFRGKRCRVLVMTNEASGWPRVEKVMAAGRTKGPNPALTIDEAVNGPTKSAPAEETLFDLPEDPQF